RRTGRFRRGLAGDPVVLAPLGDLTLPVTAAEPDLLVPRKLVPLFGIDVQDAVHELGEVLELRPPFVDDVDRGGDVGPALDRQATSLAARVTASTELLGGLAGDRAQRATVALQPLRGLLSDLGGFLATLLFEPRLSPLFQRVGRLAGCVRGCKAAESGCRRNEDSLLQAPVLVTTRQLVLHLVDCFLHLRFAFWHLS